MEESKQLDIVEFLNKYKNYVDKYKLEKIPRFNIYDLLTLSENQISRIIGWLLDPNASHGLGSSPLLEFLKMYVDENFTLENYNISKTSVKLEAPTKLLIENPDRRIDILVETPGLVLAIENKPWAEDQSSQISDYHSYIVNLAQQKSAKAHIIYLTRDRRKPSNQSIDTAIWDRLVTNGEARCIDFSGLSNWIERFSIDDPSADIAIVLINLRYYLESIRHKDFNEMISHKISQSVADEIQNAPELLEGAFAVAEAIPAIKRNGKAKLAHRLIQRFSSNQNIQINDTEEFRSGDFRTIDFKISSWVNHRLSFSFEYGGGEDGLIFGIRSLIPLNTMAEKLASQLQSQLDVKYDWTILDKDWLIWRDFGKEEGIHLWKNNPAPWIYLLKGDSEDDVITKSITKAVNDVYSCIPSSFEL